MFEDIDYADGVLNVVMRDDRAYVVNKQAPNMQIWLSSPISGPQRFEYQLDVEQWIQIRTDQEIMELLNSEFNTHFRQEGEDEVDLKV